MVIILRRIMTPGHYYALHRQINYYSALFNLNAQPCMLMDQRYLKKAFNALANISKTYYLNIFSMDIYLERYGVSVSTHICKSFTVSKQNAVSFFP